MSGPVYFSSVPENTKRCAERPGLPALRIPPHPRREGMPRVADPYGLIVPTYGGGPGGGAVPRQVIRSLNDPANRALPRGVIASGNTNFGMEYRKAGTAILKRVWEYAPGQEAPTGRMTTGSSHVMAFPAEPTRLNTPTGASVAMEPSTYPEPGVRLARLADAVGLSATWPPTEEYLDCLAERTGLRTHDLLLLADLPVPETAWLFDKTAGPSSSLVGRSLALPASSRQLLRTRARSMTAPKGMLTFSQRRAHEHFPPGFGSLLLRCSRSVT
ncbi:class Ib ribonucleoside-diphosphate reductase assembly flavoprotein NrdI [Streptomyces sp. NBC_01433]|uniref:class Ib ribonucleoside-diphosphate reductase assembly flavoprotein NrdI n=1 Tax=Streptomyces sp. NBC_01433 TaxID=2903864 RepID=UPI002250FB56|nr:class Ib ribonucleoside-diphosphate reductase assembly flavoprotein NrdI [Streptomyces sp. NBC_01433]MCX4679673.1 class Ib ribonucleoside-diphosphate reductase assembly flavoprotein NrdI [Streptomyces sp. NBC_01433]